MILQITSLVVFVTDEVPIIAMHWRVRQESPLRQPVLQDHTVAVPPHAQAMV